MPYKITSIEENFFENAEETFLDSLQNGTPDTFLSRYRAACSQLLSADGMSQSVVANVSLTLERIIKLSAAFLKLSEMKDRLQKEAVEEVITLLSVKSKTSSNIQDKQDSLNSQIFRRWFIDHIDDPFPSAETKVGLANDTNAMLEELASQDNLPKHSPRSSTKPINKEQCQLWFINTRRRSNWTEFYRQYANSSKSRMAEIVRILKHDEKDPVGARAALKSLLAQGDGERKISGKALEGKVVRCSEAWNVMLEWLEQRPREKASDWLSKVINEAKTDFKETRKRHREQRKKIQDFELKKLKELEEQQNSLVVAAKPKRSSTRKRKPDIEDETVEQQKKEVRKTRKIAHLRSDLGQMLPSTFNSNQRSSSSSRNVSGSSISSMNTDSSITEDAISGSPLAQYSRANLSLSRLPNSQALYHQPLSQVSATETSQQHLWPMTVQPLHSWHAS